MRPPRLGLLGKQSYPLRIGMEKFDQLRLLGAWQCAERKSLEFRFNFRWSVLQHSPFDVIPKLFEEPG